VVAADEGAGSFPCRAVLLAFSRDASVMHQAVIPPHPVLAASSQLQSQRPLLAYPPSGVLPFQGLSAYLAPLCFVYNSPAAVYPVWHAMYCLYWCRLHALSTDPAPAAGLPVLCRTYLDMLQVSSLVLPNLQQCADAWKCQLMQPVLCASWFAAEY
jgi:hypothetical protein